MKKLFGAAKIAFATLLGAAVISGLPADANAGSSYKVKSSALAGDPEGWSVKVGGFVLVLPEYMGSDEYQVVGGPYLDVKYSNWFFANPIDGVGVHVYNNNGLKIGGSVGYRGGREQSDDPILNGLGDIDDGAEVSAFVKYLVGPVQLSASYKHGVGEDDTGALYTIGIGSGLPLADGVLILGQISGEFMDSEYADAYFSVSAAQSAASGLAQYDAASGWRSVSASLIGVVDITDRWAFQAIGRYTYLGDHAANSPIVQERDQWFGGAGVSYKLY